MTAFDIPVLRVPREFSAASIEPFRAATSNHYSSGPCFLVFDLSSVRFISSAGLGHFIHVGRTLDEQGGGLVLAAGGRTVSKLLSDVGLTQVLPHFKTVREAVGYLRDLRDGKP